MKRIALLVAGLVLASPAWAAGGDMPVATFLAKADALKQKGLVALGSPDIKLLKAEGQAAGVAYRNRLEAERAQGRPSSCPPKGSKLGSDKLMAHLRSYPADKRGTTTMKAAMADYFIKNYPCKAG